MSTDKPRSTPTKVCPSCGTRVSESAPRCLVCGHQFTGAGRKATPASVTSGGPGGVPELRLSIPIAIGLLASFLIVGGALTFAALAGTGRVTQPTPIPSASVSPTATLSPTPETPTPTSTMQPTYTPLAYSVQAGDDCSRIAAIFDILNQDIILANSLNANCDIFQNQILVIPQPTFTPTPVATATLGEAEATIAACETEDYVVQEGDSLSLIAVSRGVPIEAILEWNRLTTDSVFIGQRITIPFCMQTFVGGATVTPTLAPPYPAAELLLPADGEPFDSSNDTISLQWASVGTLRNNEFYQVTVIDITGGQNRHIIDEVKDTSFIVPTSLRPTDGRPHVYRWSVVTVAQIGVDAEGLPVYVTGGPASETRVFIWTGTSGGATQTP
ncbi:MAG: LysM peptidoglycan-binding domain-containing protein [Chloroflexi bacterium]|nr:LysM peptidoglycan-binding domain-containing protein [Chloroflexota bacterium]